VGPIGVIIWGAIGDGIDGVKDGGIPWPTFEVTMVSKIVYNIFFHGIHLPFHFKNEMIFFL